MNFPHRLHPRAKSMGQYLYVCMYLLCRLFKVDCDCMLLHLPVLIISRKAFGLFQQGILVTCQLGKSHLGAIFVYIPALLGLNYLQAAFLPACLIDY
jgi:hypothetical protein